MSEAYEKRIQEIDKILKTKNLTPLEREMFLRRKKRYTGAIQRHAKDTLKRELQIASDKQKEKDLPAISGESLSYRRRGLRIPEQSGEVKTYERDLPATSIRKFHPNINYDMDRGIRRRLVKNPLSKI
jgi:hypothetical protein